MTHKPKPRAADLCECADRGCPAHKDENRCNDLHSLVLWRVDMEDETGTRFCIACAEDAWASGMFADEVQR